MKRALAVVAALAFAYACQIPDEHLHVRDAAGSDDDGGFRDADVGPCDHGAAWGSLAPVPGLVSLRSVARFSPDEMTAYFALGSDGTQATLPDTLFVATRTTTNAPFGTAKRLTGVNMPDGQNTPSISPDGMTLIYTWGEPPVHPAGTERDIYRATRMGSNFQFGSGEKLSFNQDGIEDDYSFFASNGDVWFASKRTGDPVVSIYKTAAVGGGAFGPVSFAGSLNSTSSPNNYPLLTTDLLHIFFQRDSTLYVASRGNPGASFGTPSTVDEINTDPQCVGTNCRPAWISPDGCRLYLGTGSAGGAVSMYVSAKPANP